MGKNCIDIKQGMLYKVQPDGEQEFIAEIKESKITCEEEPENLPGIDTMLNQIGAGINITFTLKGDFKVTYRQRLSFLYGFKVTNNFLKMHGGIMERNGGKRKRPAEGKRRLRKGRR